MHIRNPIDRAKLNPEQGADGVRTPEIRFVKSRRSNIDSRRTLNVTEV